LARTPELLPILKQAGVVDAGGQGLVHILDGMLRYVQGELYLETDQQQLAEVPAQARAAPAEGIENPYDVQFLLVGEKLDVLSVRQSIDAMGDSTVVVGDESTVKVHIHVKDPGVPLSFGASLGRITDVVVENMQIQMEDIIGPSEFPAAENIELQLELAPGQIGVVAVAAGEGLAEIFRSLGVSGIVNGGQSNNPSTQEIYQVIEAMKAESIIVLPNNKNIILAAEAAGELSRKDVLVVPSRTAPQGISALLALDSGGTLEDAQEAMTDACDYVASGEIAVATRSVDLDGVAVDEGQIIGVADGQLCAAGNTIDEVLAKILEGMDMEERELLSIYYGQDVTEPEAEEVVSNIQSLYPDVEVELLFGGQGIYQYILGAE
jgi:DAK2 domain fusion protein YloV